MGLELWIVFIVCALVAALGLVAVFLQKMGKVHPFVIKTTFACDFASGGTVTLAGAFLGAAALWNVGTLPAILYLAVIGGLYILIQIVCRGK